MNKRLMVVAGGTGGHIFPGIAVADELKRQGWQVSWLGTRDRMEAEVVPAHGIDIDFIEVRGVRGNGLKRLIKAPLMILKAFFQARRVLKQRRPDVLLAMGGYVTGPAGLAAKSLGIPLVIHEQNAVAGMSNRWLARLADRVLGAFPSAFPGKMEVVGNPVRESVAAIDGERKQGPVRILVVGGSLGAQALNETLPGAFVELNRDAALEVWHQTGKGHQASVSDAYKDCGFNVRVDQFIDDMAAAYGWADMVVCRAGALTVSEIAAAGKMAVFVPYPHAVDDHQTANANYLVEEHAALLLPQWQMNRERLIELLTPYVQQPDLISEMAKKAKALAKLDATAQVALRCEQVTE